MKFGIFVPQGWRHDLVGIDPALAMGPFITVSNDILGLAIFFAVATVLYL